MVQLQCPKLGWTIVSVVIYVTSYTGCPLKKLVEREQSTDGV